MEDLGYPNVPPAALVRVFHDILDDPSVRVLVVEDKEGVLAMALLGVRPQLRIAGTLVSIDEFVVAEKARNRGVGTLLLDGIKKLAKELGALRVELHTRRTRESYTRGFYGKHGFQEVDSAVLRWSP